jgi:hypothetical protein
VLGGGEQLVEHPRVDRGPVGGHLDRSGRYGERTLEEPAGRFPVTSFACVHVDDLPELVDRPVQVAPLAVNFHIGFVDLPSVAGHVPAGSGDLDERRGKPAHPPVHAGVVDRDATFGEQLLDVAVGQAESQVPAHRHGDQFGWEAEPGELRTRATHPC